MGSIMFASPYCFLLAAPLLFAAWRMFRRARSQAAAFPALALVPRAASWRQRLAALPPALLALGMAALIMAAARPQTRLSQSRKSAEAIAIEMTVDVSGSMRALDFATKEAPRKNRLDVVKEAFAEFVAARPDDLIGLVTFGGYATTRSPLTFDHDAVLFFLKDVRIPESHEVVAADELETAIGDGLAMACARLAAATNVKSRIVVLLSDGESNAGIVTPEQATALAKQQGVKVYAIGVGSTGAAPVPATDMFGRQVITQAYFGMDEKALRRIADDTGGMYFNVKNKKGLEEALAEIAKLEKTEVSQTVYYRNKEHFRPFLGAGAALVLLAALIAPKGRKSLV